ncbi:MAG: hypothetical protein ACFFG0_42450 [Candidatus Thorarchaeota archaeon]
MEQIEYKAKIQAVDVLTIYENHTSKCSFLDNEPIGKHETNVGKRISKNLFKFSKGI